ncbi:hypothetical protein [Plantactinospora sp. DSM 117369]
MPTGPIQSPFGYRPPAIATPSAARRVICHSGEHRPADAMVTTTAEMCHLRLTVTASRRVRPPAGRSQSLCPPSRIGWTAPSSWRSTAMWPPYCAATVSCSSPSSRLGRVRQQTTFLANGLTPTMRWKLDQAGGTTTADAAGNNTGTVGGAVTWSAERSGVVHRQHRGFDRRSAAGRHHPGVHPDGLGQAGSQGTDRHVIAIGGDLNNSALKLFYDKAADSWRLTMAVRRADGTVGFQPSTSTTGSATSDWQHLAGVVTPATTPGGTSTAQLYVHGAVKGALSTTEQFNNQASICVSALKRRRPGSSPVSSTMFRRVGGRR